MPLGLPLGLQHRRIQILEAEPEEIRSPEIQGTIRVHQNMP
jgi:hypothetical protein